MPDPVQELKMSKVVSALILALTVIPAFPALKPCEELKSEIVAKLEAKGVKEYHVDIVAAGEVKDKTVVGSCEGGAKKITYTKNAGAPAGPKAQLPAKTLPAK
jgi:Protein of unknown function (DUF1161)